MPLQHAVLGLLVQGPSYGYELKASFEHAIGSQWGEVNIGHVYQVLDRLVRDGFVTKKIVRQRDRPDKVVYRLTEAGEAELIDWLDRPVSRRAGYRDDFFLKVFIASRLGAPCLRAAARLQRESYLGELASLTELRERQTGDPLITLLIDAAIVHTEASLKVVERASERADEIAANAEANRAGPRPAEEPRLGDRARRRNAS